MANLVSLSLIGHVVAALAIGFGVVASYRWIRRRSEVLGAIIAAGILTRVGLGLALFWISYLGLPIAQSLQSGGGFWELAVDARNYYNVAARAVEAGSLTMDPLAPSPFFTWILALWMLAVGVSPAAAMFLNLCLYVTLAAVVVWFFAPVNDWRRDLPCVVLVGAYSFLPVILIHSTQPLKDELFNVLLATVCLGVLSLRRLMHRPPNMQHHWFTVAGAVAVTAATFGAAGIRWYFGFIIWCCLALVLATFAVRGRTMPLPRYLAGSVTLLLVVWFGFWAGSGRYYWLAAELTSPARLSNITQLARVGFLTSGGGTNIVVPFREDLDAGRLRHEELLTAQRGFEGAQERAATETAYLKGKAAARSASSAAARSASPAAARSASPAAATSPTAPAGATSSATPAAAAATTAPAPEALVNPTWGPATRAMPITMREQVTAVATGLAVVFVPLSLVEAVSSVEIQGGRGLLSIVDLDTVVLDIASLLVLGLLWRRRKAIGDRLPFVVFGLILAGVSAFLLGYVVTNFGTLWRLRSLIAVPLWILAVALSPRPEPHRERPDLGEQALVG